MRQRILAGAKRGARFSPGELRLDFRPTELPRWRSGNEASTSILLSKIQRYVSQYRHLSAEDKAWAKDVYSQRALGEYLFQVNHIENEGFDTYAETKAALEQGLVDDTATEDDRVVPLRGLRDALNHWSLCWPEEDQMDRLLATHSIFFGSSLKKSLAGRLRQRDSREEMSFVYRQFPASVYVFLWPSQVPERLKLLLKRVSVALGEILSDEHSQVARLMNLAGSFFHEFEAIHPFLDGNGRMGRILTASLLHSIMPFPNVLFVDYGRVIRDELGEEEPPFVLHSVYYECFQSAQWKQGNLDLATCNGDTVVVELDHPKDLTALLIEGVYVGWKRFYAALEERSSSVATSFGTLSPPSSGSAGGAKDLGGLHFSNDVMDEWQLDQVLEDAGLASHEMGSLEDKRHYVKAFL